MRAVLGVMTSVVVTLTLVVGVAPAPASAQTAQAPVAGTTETTLTAPAQVTLRRPVTIGATVVAAGAPVTEGSVRFERPSPAGWVGIGEGVVDARGTAAVQVVLDADPGALRAVYTGSGAFEPSTSAAVPVQGVPQAASVVLRAPRSVVDERTLDVSAAVTTPDGPVPGAAVSFQVYRSKAWRTYGVVSTDANGVARTGSRPRLTYRYRAVVAAGSWYTGARTATATVRNVPPGTVVKLPRKAPRPTRLPAQPRASGDGANASVSRIGDATWRSMKGRSWRAGCPVGRASLRLVRVNYWGFDGYRHRGEIVVHSSIAGKTARAFSDLYRNRVPIRSMYRVDRFGYSSRVKGADDHASMRADNTSGFNCRSVIGRPSIRSPHALGRAIDINPFENPYRYRWGRWAPNSWWKDRAAGTYAWTKRSHLVPTIMRRNGFRWTYGAIDGQHFDG
ncbi:M15 family metallopeptidase [Aeromicrobium sp. CFBP 8757]|uniref:M15 family metallopeptidase n=1 Tax=Aeromicrobium sp. CFBP 8757 TaxID=2775288 RepID=UPI0017807933|nr:M15 family metallopeptidase [Aeromicrobium sp. CFBP 8757]MBD8605985.1 M15 family metallopeptidase [Aeromicrobium sp. CFBP 8757]